MSDWPKYESHKIVQAAKIVDVMIDNQGVMRGITVDPGNGVIEPFWPTRDAMADEAKIGGYAMLYPDGFKSVSPAKAFEEGYTLCP